MRHKHTKIVATLSPSHSVDTIRKLYEAGMNVVRINTAHASETDALSLIKKIRRVSETIAILIDTKGPEVRVTRTAETLHIEQGERVVIESGTEQSTVRKIFVNYEHFCRDVPNGSTILINDGSVELKVIKKTPKQLHCRVTVSGTFSSNKGVNTPDVQLKLPSTTLKDRAFIRFAKKHDIDFIAHSFVRSRKDVLAVRSLLKGTSIKIIAKIENQEGVDNIDEIIDVADGIMVARGDLGIEVSAAQVPIIQKMIIAKCRAYAKPVITATQMLESMIDHARPTRAEVSDVANAVLDGTDALMLSGETAAGKHPVQAVMTMASIAKTIEEKKGPVMHVPVTSPVVVNRFLARQAVYAQRELDTKAIIINTMTGATARRVASYRGRNPVLALSPSKTIMRQLNLSYGVRPFYLPVQQSTDTLVSTSLKLLSKTYTFNASDLLIILGKTPGPAEHSNFLEIATYAHCTRKKRK